MQNELITPIISEIASEMNIYLILLLMAIGALIKHWVVLDKISNKLIPPILIAVAVIYSAVMADSYTITAITSNVCDGLINASIAVLLHQTGKNVFIMIAEKSNISTDQATTEEETHDSVE